MVMSSPTTTPTTGSSSLTHVSTASSGNTVTPTSPGAAPGTWTTPMAWTSTHPTPSWSPAPRPWAQSHSPDRLSFTFRDQSDRRADNLQSDFKIVRAIVGLPDELVREVRRKTPPGVGWCAQRLKSQRSGEDMAAPSFTALTPLAFLERAADVFADKTAISYGDRRLTFSEFGAQATRLARALQASGIKRGDRVAYMCPNIPEMLVANFGVPLAGAVMVPINTRLSADEVRYICDHSGAKLLVVDTEYLPVLAPVLDGLKTIQEVVAVTDPLGPASPEAAELANISYDELMARGSDDPLPWTVDDELSLIAINYSSGTTGQPKGAMYTHRGAYLNALGEIIHQRFDPESVYPVSYTHLRAHETGRNLVCRLLLEK